MRPLLLTTIIALFLTGNALAQGCFSNPTYSQDGYGLYPSTVFDMDCNGTSASSTIIGITDTVQPITLNPGSPENILYHCTMCQVAATSYGYRPDKV